MTAPVAPAPRHHRADRARRPISSVHRVDPCDASGSRRIRHPHRLGRHRRHRHRLGCHRRHPHRLGRHRRHRHRLGCHRRHRHRLGRHRLVEAPAAVAAACFDRRPAGGAQNEPGGPVPLPVRGHQGCAAGVGGHRQRTRRRSHDPDLLPDQRPVQHLVRPDRDKRPRRSTAVSNRSTAAGGPPTSGQIADPDPAGARAHLPSGGPPHLALGQTADPDPGATGPRRRSAALQGTPSGCARRSRRCVAGPLATQTTAPRGSESGPRPGAPAVQSSVSTVRPSCESACRRSVPVQRPAGSVQRPAGSVPRQAPSALWGTVTDHLVASASEGETPRAEAGRGRRRRRASQKSTAPPRRHRSGHSSGIRAPFVTE